MRDVVKTNVKREQNSKRVRRRKKKVSLYIFLILLLAAGIGVLLSVTLLFNINNIKVNGNVDYSDETVLDASGLSKGDNLVRLDAKKAEGKILSSMVYIEDVNINKKYPDTLEINLTKCIPAASVECEGGYLLISRKGKILDNVKSAQADCFVIKGFESSLSDLGKYIQSTNEQKTEICQEILEALGKYDDQRVVSVDMTDIYDIVINYDNRINFELGNSNDISYKLKLADTVLKDIGSGKKGTMVMVGANQISFRSDGGTTADDKKTQNGRIPISEEDLPEGYTENSSENTNEVIENDDSEYIDDNGESYGDDEAYADNETYNDDEYSDDIPYEDEYADDTIADEDYENGENDENYDDYAE